MITSLLLLITGGVVAHSDCFDATPSERTALRVLFIGNSYTHVNKLPEILEQFSAAARFERQIRCTMATVGGATLERHWNNPDFRELLNSRKWDIVVLQEQSLRPIEKPEAFWEYARLWGKKIKANGAKPFFYMTWARKATPKKQATYTENYRKAARGCGGTVVPVGEAWKVVREKRPEIELFTADGSHPSPAGSYLAACVFYAVITGRSPVGLPDSYTVSGGDKPKEKKFSREDARYLQRAARDAAKREKVRSGD